MSTEREKTQQEALHTIKEVGDGIVLLPTRYGKTKVIIDYLNTLDSRQKVLYVVPSANLRDKGVPEEVEKWGDPIVKNKLSSGRIKLLCYSSLKKIKEEHYDVIILDEIQEMSINQGLKFFFKNANTWDKLLGITGTLPDDRKKMKFIEKELGLKVIYEKSIQTAVETGVLAPFEFWIVQVPLSRHKDIEIKYKDKTTGEPKSFMTSEHSQYEYYAKLSEKYEREGEYPPQHIANKRAMMLRSTKSKHKALAQTLEALKKTNPEYRILTFSPTILKADSLGNSYHSQSDRDSTIMRDFENKTINHLSLVKRGGVGTTYRDLDFALIGEVDSKSHSLLQRHGRLLLPRPGYTAISFVFVAKDTVEEIWIEKATKDVAQTVKKLDYEELHRFISPGTES